jgi:hypothetical protein
VVDPTKMFHTLPFGTVMQMADQELVEVARRSEPSILRNRSYKGMSLENWIADVNSELASRCPMVAYIFSTLLQSDVYPQKKLPAASLIYGIIMFLRCHELSMIQRINTILLTQGNASTNVSSLLNL